MGEFGLGAWLHRITQFKSAEDVETYGDRLAAGGYDIFIPCVKNTHGAVDFQTDLADVNDKYPACDPLKLLIEGCRRRGVKTHVWFCVFPEGSNSRLLREHPDCAAVHEPQPNQEWACACRQEVQDYVFAIYEDLAKRYKPDGLHLDYIRTGGPCRCEACKRQMASLGVDIETVCEKDAGHDLWVDWRVSRVTDFVRRMRELTKRERMELSAAVFPSYPRSVSNQGQDWVAWAEEGLVDYLMPMGYRTSVRQARAFAVSHVALAGGKVPIWSGIGKASAESTLTPDALGEQIRSVIEAGAEGAVIFEDRAMTNQDFHVIKRLRSK